MLLADSKRASWHSVFLRHDRSEGISAEFEKPATTDHTLVVVLKGQCELVAASGGRPRITQRRTGSAALTPGGETRRFRWISGGRDRSHETAHLYLPQYFIRAAADHYRRPGDASPEAPLRSLAFDDPAVTAIVFAMVQAMATGAPDFYAEAAAHWLAVHLLAQTSPWRQRITDGRDAGDLSDVHLARVVDFMRANLCRALSLEILASEAGISRYHFARLFSRRTGETPLGYHTRLRLEGAYRLLASTDLPIRQVAVSCGYLHPSNFDTAFRRRYGHTPKQTRSSSV
jgi:AraC family transcriptional regulator